MYTDSLPRTVTPDDILQSLGRIFASRVHRLVVLLGFGREQQVLVELGRDYSPGAIFSRSAVAVYYDLVKSY